MHLILVKKIYLLRKRVAKYENKSLLFIMHMICMLFQLTLYTFRFVSSTVERYSYKVKGVGSNPIQINFYNWYVMLCYVMLCYGYVMLCYVMLCYVRFCIFAEYIVCQHSANFQDVQDYIQSIFKL